MWEAWETWGWFRNWARTVGCFLVVDAKEGLSIGLGSTHLISPSTTPRRCWRRLLRPNSRRRTTLRPNNSASFGTSQLGTNLTGKIPRTREFYSAIVHSLPPGRNLGSPYVLDMYCTSSVTDVVPSRSVFAPSLLVRARFDNGYLSIKRPLLPDLDLFGRLSNSPHQFRENPPTEGTMFAAVMVGYQLDLLTRAFGCPW